MKKKKRKLPYVFERQVNKAQALCEADMAALMSQTLRGKTLPEQLHERGIRCVVIDNHYKHFGFISSVFASEARSLFPRIPGLMLKDLCPRDHNFYIGINSRRHRHYKGDRFWVELARTLGHEVGHTWHLDSRNCLRRDSKQTGHLSVRRNDNADEDFCYDFGELWASQKENFEQTKELFRITRSHGNFFRILPTHFIPFTR